MSTEEHHSPESAKEYFREVTDTVCGTVEKPVPRIWYPLFAVSLALVGLLLWSLYVLFFTGVGVWGNNNTEAWAFPIVNFVFWIGIGHAGTLISAILFLMRQKWRTSINRAAEAMTLFAVVCAGLFPVIHTGRPWVAYFLLPLPNDMAMWPQFRSPLMWDVFAVSTYLTVSVLFWYTGLVPDLATLRDRTTSRVKRMVYGIFSLGWRGSARQWHRYERAYLILAALSTPLVFSVHSVVSFDFAVAQMPGWHSTIFPPYFVAGAIFSGFAMVLTLMVPCRYLFGWKNILKESHIESMCKVVLATGAMVGFSYGTEFFVAWYSGNLYEKFVLVNRALGPYTWAYFIMVGCNVVAPQLYWFKFFRRNPFAVVGVALLVNLGMWFERFVIVVTSLSRTWMPSTWHYFHPTLLDFTTLLGSFGLFFTLFLIFVRYLPAIAMFEVKGGSNAAHAGGGHPPEGTEHHVPSEPETETES